MSHKISSPAKQKILLLLLSGVALGCSGSPRQYFRTIKRANKAWKSIDEQYLKRIIREFYRERLVERIENENGSTRIVITEKGREKALEFKIHTMRIAKPSRWDGKWRVVMFDVPEKKKRHRDVLREKLQDLKFLELQKSVLVHPYPCLDEINFIVEYYGMRKFVRCAEMINLTNEAELKLHFKLK